jgi:hypothetical protein
VLNVNFSSTRLRNYAAAINAQFWRIGGSEDVDIKYLCVRTNDGEADRDHVGAMSARGKTQMRLMSTSPIFLDAVLAA